jgi:4-amino-4-deoxy-L-arabinose transferase-like glycosyltransferase
MNQPYVSTASSFEANRRRGRVPTDDVLAAARQPMVLLGAGAVALTYGLGALLGGPLAGVVAAGLALSSGFVRYTLVHAWAEAPLAFFLALSALLVALGARWVAAGRPWLGCALGAGLALGLACTTKLTGYVGLVATTGLAVLAAPVAWRAARRGLPPVGTPVRWLVAGAVVGLVALLVPVILNPFLWRGPVRGLAEMVVQRRDEMAAQQKQWPEYAVLTWVERPGAMLIGSTRFGPWDDAPAAAVPLNLALVGAGVVSLALAARRRQAPPGGWLAALVLLAWLAAYLAAILGGLGLTYPRYFLPGLLFLLPLAGLGAAVSIERARRAVSRR